jgi:hypothetical protein
MQQSVTALKSTTCKLRAQYGSLQSSLKVDQVCRDSAHLGLALALALALLPAPQLVLLARAPWQQQLLLLLLVLAQALQHDRTTRRSVSRGLVLQLHMLPLHSVHLQAAIKHR